MRKSAPGGFIAQLSSSWRMLRFLYGESSARVAALMVASTMAGIAEAVVLALIANVAAAMVVHEQVVTADLGALSLHLGIGWALGLALIAAALRLLLQLAVAWLPAQISADVQAGLRRDLFNAHSRASWQAQVEDAEGLFQELMTSQVNQTTQVVLQVITALSGSAMFLALTATAFLLSPLAALTIIGAAVLLFALLRPLARLGRAAGRDLSHANVVHASGVGEAVRLAKEAQVFGVRDAVRDHVDVQIMAARNAFFRFQLTGGLVRNTYQSLVILLVVAGLLALFTAGAGNLTALGAVALMLVRASSYAQQFQSGFQSFNQLLPYVERIHTAITRYSSSVPTEGARLLSGVETLALHDVGFSYRSGPIALQDVSFKVRAGESIGVVGPSGAGKSTLAELLLRLREPAAGEYRINGELANTFKPDDWHRQFAYVAQEPQILQATVAENIRFFRDVDDVAVERAARLAHIHNDTMQLPAGYNTIIGQQAIALSGGQRQRICLARALAAEPSVLVLDEPTSALDPVSETAVQASLAELGGRVMLFIIAHRLSTLSDCDRILVLDGGRIQAFAHASRLQTSSTYFRSAVDRAALPTARPSSHE